jgi:nucleotide-binding universal stress UspA family protein
MDNILAVITNWEDAAMVLKRAERLAEQFKTSVELLRPVYSPFAQLSKYSGFSGIGDMRSQIMAEESKLLEELASDRNWNIHVEWCERVHQLIAERAESFGAGLIVMMASHDSILSSLAHTPDDWHLFRHATCPVLSMVRDSNPLVKVIAAVDALDQSEAQKQLSARVIDQARALAKAEEVPLMVLTVVPDPAILYAGMVNAPMGGDFQQQAMAEAETRLRELLQHLGIEADSVLVKGGWIEDIATKEGQQGGLLVIGSAANKGVKGFFIGNTAERILHHMKSDMLVVN